MLLTIKGNIDLNIVRIYWLSLDLTLKKLKEKLCMVGVFIVYMIVGIWFIFIIRWKFLSKSPLIMGFFNKNIEKKQNLLQNIARYRKVWLIFVTTKK